MLLKHAYCRVIDPLDRSRQMQSSVAVTLHVPTYYSTEAWSNYEGASMRACHRWLNGNPDAVFADVGCSIAIYSLMALQVSHKVRVFAFDSDRNSLSASAEFCRFSDVSRLELVHGFMTGSNLSKLTLSETIDRTSRARSAAGVSAEPTSIRYLCLDRPIPDEEIPRHSLDGMLLDANPMGRPLFIKIDVEGAELVVLSGASALLRLHRPTLLLSVHPQFLPSFKQNPEDVSNFLKDHGYRWSPLSADHEEHWWCEPIEKAAEA
jgi:FkbM family methyltransferase